MMRMRYRLLPAAFLSACIGCGPDSPFDYVKVDGTVAYEDGAPLPASGLELRFYALDAMPVQGAKPRPAIAHVNAEGRFECVTSYKYGDGLIPGRHRVAILNAADNKGKPLVPLEYSSTANSPLVIDTETIPLEIRVPKP